jgi:hypothetical protein
MSFSKILVIPKLLQEDPVPQISQKLQKKFYLYSFTRPVSEKILDAGDDYFPGTVCSRNDPAMRPVVSSFRRELEKTLNLNLFTTCFLDVISYPGIEVEGREGVPTREYSLIVNLGGNTPEPLTVFLSTFADGDAKEHILEVGDALLFKGLEFGYRINPVKSLYENEGTTGLFDDDSNQRFLVCNFVNADGYFTHYAYSG